MQVRSLKTAIAKASSLDEIERLNQMLRSGTVSFFFISNLKDDFFFKFSDAGDEAQRGDEWGRNGDRVKT